MEGYEIERMYQKAIEVSLAKFEGFPANQDVMDALKGETLLNLREAWMSIPEYDRKFFAMPIPIVKIDDGFVVIELIRDQLYNI